MNWSCTSSYFRNLLAPYVFKSVKLRNDEKSGESVSALLKGPFGALIRELYFIGTIPPEAAKETDEANEKSYEASNITLPPIVSSILSDLRQFPSLDALSMGFTYPYADSPFDDYYGVEDIVDNENPQRGLAWRSLMATTYETLLRNKEPRFKEFEIRNLVWTFVEPFKNAGFHELLGHMERFALSVRGGDNGAGWHVNTLDGYLACIQEFDKLFFNHLRSVTSMTLKAPDQGPIGLEGLNHTKLMLEENQMPLLRELRLEYCFICEELAAFVRSHADTLETLTLYGCASSVNGLQDHDGYYWNDLFTAFDSADLTALSKLVILPLNPPLTSNEEFPHQGQVDEKDEPTEVQQVRQLLRENPKRRLFAYAILDDKYGMFFQDVDENVEAFQRGEDQAAYDRVMERMPRWAGRT